MPSLEELLEYYDEGQVDAPLIKGLLYEVTADELSKHAKSKAREYIKRAEGLDAGAKSAIEPNHGVSLVTQAKYQRERAAFFTWAADHFIEDAVYRLNFEEITLLELAIP
jgi:hypothetical protein